MKRGRLPLTALRSFEAAGRLENITKAAAELYVSQAAVSRQVRELETILGQKLFERQHRRIRLTPAGSTLLGVLTDGFDRMEDCIKLLSETRETAVLTVSVEPGFAAMWLVQNLADFRTEYPAIDVNVDADGRLIEFRSGDAELAIRFSCERSKWPRTQAKRLYDINLTPVASPDLLARTGVPKHPADLRQYTLLHEEDRILWQEWFAAAQVAHDPIQHGPLFADGGLVMQAMLDGQGIGILDKRLVAREVANGRLVQLFDVPLQFGTYWLVARDFSKLSPPGANFADWLTARLGS
ncbi:LysR substrate-binding domain-containing protein [Anderseniella sp. Alg231-50]|uniref:LysR substrate-binding domain-containing protein n=1 Tax=Anderseniella sp. Alg231-50 TaxID=1922226 RepID=UPI000D54CC77